MQKKIIRSSRIKYFIAYTIVFALVMSVVFAEFIINNTTLVALNDSIIQHYPYMIKVKELYESFFAGFFTNESMELVDFSSYFGLNVIATFQYYGFGNPIYLITLLFDESSMPYVYTALMFLKIYLGGIAFSALCFQYDRKQLYTLLGTIVYITNPFVMASLEQMCFLDVLYQFPLLIIGFNQILKGRNSKLFIGTVMISALSGYYFLYIMTAMLAVYGVLYVIRNNSGIKNILMDGIIKLKATVVHYMLGIMLAAPVFVPSIIGLFDSYRTGRSTGQMNILYDADYYLEELLYLFFYNSKNYFSLNIVVLIIFVFLFVLYRNKFKFHKVLILISIIGVQLPIVGTVMNGMFFPSNRWLFGFYLVSAFVCVDVLSITMQKIKKGKIPVCVFLSVLICAQACILTTRYEDTCTSAKEVQAVIESTISDEIEIGSRMDGDGELLDNTSVYYEVSKPQTYLSVIPSSVIESELDINLSSVANTNMLESLDSRAELEALFNIEYYLTTKKNADIPYGFSLIGEEDGKYTYRNENTLPFGYTYDSYLHESELKDIMGVEKSWLYMEHAVVSDSQYDANIVKADINHNNCIKSDITIENTSDGRVCVRFENISNAEVYLKCNYGYDNRISDTVYANDIEKTIKFASKETNWYIPVEYKVFHIGYFENISEIYLTGDYEYEDIEIYYHPMDKYENQIDKLSKYHLENVKFSENRICGKIEIPEARLLCLSIPNIDGWSAYVDGEKADIITVNGMFMGIDLLPGNHIIELKYKTPGLLMGKIIFFLAVVILIVWKYKIYKKSIGES